ncbi:hypothetical protein EI983_10910 [Roseovarius faecimaris]|uniref:Host specificity protein n=1 Tax=Roseovarius faecimaris TaxID=2494550 RepID=A0A6I6IRA6_9RHOB|nr:glycoside hydrolase TIM-barrel-like domain-containing protein [Roseovarius faecimaris]QGX98752.1 hypothetical protein EI983_10910 [Roseovarius faecimaris]
MTQQNIRSGAAWIASEGPETQAEFLDSLDEGELIALPFLFEFWAMEHQLPPEGPWRTWVAMGGRGAGKTRAGSEWVRAQVEGPRPLDPGRCQRIALVGETIDQVREVMVFGESGILACSPPDRRPEWQATRKRLIWPNGATAQAFSAHDPESLRGPQFDGAWVDEYGCAAIDKGTNQPNKFLDPKSSESRLPYHSNGRQDELIQMQYLRAMAAYWSDPANNPVSVEYEAPMLDWDHSYVWAWDARPYPFFPNNRALWGDGGNYARGHWLTGRASARTLAGVVAELCERAGLKDYDVSGLYGHLRGYIVEDVSDARTALQALVLRYGFDAIDRGGVLTFRMRDGRKDYDVDPARVVRESAEAPVIEESRGSAVELAGRVRLRFVESNGDYEVIAEEAILPEDETHTVSISEVPISMTRAEGRQTVERWLSESRLARDTVRLTLPPSQMDRGAGDVIALPEEGGAGLYRIDRIEQLGLAQRVDAVRIEPESYVPITFPDDPGTTSSFVPPKPVTAMFMDLPLIPGNTVPHAPYLAVTANPWPGYAALYSSDSDDFYALNTLLYTPTPIGVTETPLRYAASGCYDRGAALQVRMIGGQLNSVDDLALLNGANLCAIGDGSPGNWELFQFRDAELVGTETYALSMRLRGQLGTDALMPSEWPAGSLFVRFDQTAEQIVLTENQLGLERHYRVGPGDRFYTDPSFQHVTLTFEGIGLRPYAPVHLMAEQSGAGDVALRWIRRTRVGGDRWETPEVPLGEESELYLVRVVQTGNLLREEMVSTPAWTYTAAMRAADGQAGFYEIEVAQISASYGAGPAVRITLAA